MQLMGVGAVLALGDILGFLFLGGCWHAGAVALGPGMIGSNMVQSALMLGLTPNICLYDIFISYSGVCYASEKCFGRSANRGECAQFCRMKFDF